jgi:hypothetical protein
VNRLASQCSSVVGGELRSNDVCEEELGNNGVYEEALLQKFEKTWRTQTCL